MTKSSIPILDIYKLSQDKKRPPFESQEALLKNVVAQSQFAQQRFENSIKMPKTEHANIEAASSLQKSLGDKPTGWAALASGVLEGFSLGEKKKSILDDKERLKKYNETVAKLENVAAQSGERLASFQKQEQVKESLTPYVSRTLDLILEKAPQERIDLAGMDLTRRYNQSTGENWEYEMGNGKGIAVMNSKTGESAILPWSSLTSPELEEKVMMANPIYQSQLLRQQQMEDREMRLMEMSGSNRGVGAVAQKQPEKTPEDMQRETYLQLHELLKNGDPTIGAGTKLLENTWGNIPVLGSNPLTAEQQQYRQMLSDLKGQVFKKFGYRNQAEFDHIQTLPENLPREQASKLIEAELKKLGVDPSQIQSQTTNPVTPPQSIHQDVPNIISPNVKVILPGETEIIEVNPDDAEKLKLEGAQIVD